jgi:hypothetical protein
MVVSQHIEEDLSQQAIIIPKQLSGISHEIHGTAAGHSGHKGHTR